MFCKNCGIEIADDSRYCKYCGAAQLQAGESYPPARQVLPC
jgi:uncharacterized membrane protein YvbJ